MIDFPSLLQQKQKVFFALQDDEVIKGAMQKYPKPTKHL
jgi:hypothetical protein